MLGAHSVNTNTEVPGVVLVTPELKSGLLADAQRRGTWLCLLGFYQH